MTGAKRPGWATSSACRTAFAALRWPPPVSLTRNSSGIAARSVLTATLAHHVPSLAGRLAGAIFARSHGSASTTPPPVTLVPNGVEISQFATRIAGWRSLFPGAGST